MSAKSVLITGCSDGGIGAALAHSFADRDFRVFATARDPGKMTSLAKRPNVTLVKLDITNAGHLATAVSIVHRETNGRLNFLVNNAGRTHFMPLLDDSIEQAKAIFDTNVWGTLAVTQAFSSLLIAAQGAIINITSISGYVNIPWLGTYAASKRSMEIMGETLRLELRPFGVRVMSVITGTVKTHGQDYFEDLKLPEQSLYASIESTIRGRARGAGGPSKRMPASEYAEKIMPSLLKSDSSGLLWGPGFTTGFVKVATAWLPGWLLDSMWIKGTGVDSMLNASASQKSQHL